MSNELKNEVTRTEVEKAEVERTEVEIDVKETKISKVKNKLAKHKKAIGALALAGLGVGLAYAKGRLDGGLGIINLKNGDNVDIFEDENGDIYYDTETEEITTE